MAGTRASTRASTRIAKTPSIRQSFGKVTKATRAHEDVSVTKKTIEVEAIPPSQVIPPATEEGKKRKRNVDEEETEECDVVKKPRASVVSVLTQPKVENSRKPRSRTTNTATRSPKAKASETPVLPTSLETYISMHESFVKAMSLHFAHNGPATPANLTNLLEGMTRLWKKRQVQKQDIRKMLALLEFGHGSKAVFPESSQTVQRGKGIFRLLQSGLGIQHLLIEFVGSATGSAFQEQQIQSAYSDHIQGLWKMCQKDGKACKVLEDSDRMPQLAIEMGAQQAIKQEKAKQLRAEILFDKKVPAPSPITVTPETTTTPQANSAPARKQTLLDRILEKQRAQLANPKPSTEELAIHHAKGRIPELVDILNIIQKQRTRNQAIPRISFQFMQLAQNIKDSVRVPISDQDIRLGLKLLSTEVAKEWVSLTSVIAGSTTPVELYDKENVRSDFFIVLNGRGISSVEAKQRMRLDLTV